MNKYTNKNVQIDNSVINNKYNELISYLNSLTKVAVAFSSGVDSAFLLYAAIDALGPENVIAITASSCIFPNREFEESIEFCKSLSIKQIIIYPDVLSLPEFTNNPKNRCYICKYNLFSLMKKCAKEYRINNIIEGSNMDDNNDYRPGHKAITDLDILSPLRQVNLYKSEIRELSKLLNLPTWNKPSFACLASRFVYGESITETKLKMVEQAEKHLFNLGFSQIRVRIHGDKDYIARIEVLPEDFCKITITESINNITSVLSKLGFTYITLDLQGYRTGSMNETIL